ncbi:MAG: hypothetical protein ACKVZJ_04330 [Phycisphaerales bacterium]
MKNLALTAFVIAAGAASASAGLIVNGTFDGGTIAPAASAYPTDPEMWPEGRHNVTSFDTLHPLWVDFFDHTSGNGESGFMIVNGTTQGNGPAWYDFVQVDPGTEFELSLWLASLYPDAVSTVSLRVIGLTDETGSDLIASSDVTAPTELALWERRAMTFNSGNFTNLRIEIWDTNQVAGGNDYAVDDIALVPVPAPGAAALLGLGMLAGSRRRR